MPEGMGYVIATYGATFATLVLWFWLIAIRFRRNARAAHAQDRQP